MAHVNRYVCNDHRQSDDEDPSRNCDCDGRNEVCVCVLLLLLQRARERERGWREGLRLMKMFFFWSMQRHQ